MKRNAGFSLIEVVISSALIATAVGSVFAVSSMTIRLSTGGQQRLIAAQLAREGIEITRHIRDSNFVANPCQTGFDCRRAWTDGILASGESLPLASSIAKKVVDTAGVKSLQTVGLTTPCTDVFRRDTSPGGGGIQTVISNAPTDNGEIYCRRILIEPINDPSLSSNAIRVRSQVAWLSERKRLFRTLTMVRSAPECPGVGSMRDVVATEWCTEQVTILTNWRGQP